MRKSVLFRSLCTLMAWVYCTAAVQAGQVITQGERDWAKKTVDLAKSEKNLTPLGNVNTLAVLNFNNKTGLEDLTALEKGLAIMLITDLSKVDKIQVVERIKMQALLDEMELGASGLVDPATAPKIGKILGAYNISTGDINSGKMTAMNINPVMIDVPFETVTSQAATAGDKPDIFRMEKDILFSIINQMTIVLTPKEKEELNKPFAVSMAAAMAFFLGVDLSDKGKYAEAAKMYEKAIMEDPNFGMANDALQELKTLGLTDAGEVAKTSTKAPVEPVEEGSSIGGTTLAVLGLAAVGGGVALALSSGGSDDDDGTPTRQDNSTTGNAPYVTRTSPVAGSEMESCTRGYITYYFNENIQNCANVRVEGGWQWNSQLISGNQLQLNYRAIYYSDKTTVCDLTSGSTMTTTVSGCQDMQGNTMRPASFSYSWQL